MIFGLKEFIIGYLSLAFLLGILQWLLSLWIKTRLEQSIRHEYDKKLEEYRFSQLQRKKAEIVAQFFAKWIKYGGLEKQLLDKYKLIDYYEELNRMSLELSLWIPDEEILNDIFSRLCAKENAKDIRTLTGQIRKLILSNKDDSFNPQKIVLWTDKSDKQG